MSTSVPSAPPIPYAGVHAGPRRVLTITTRRGLVSSAAVMMNIDGAQYPRPWGTSTFEVPADRPCSVAVCQARYAGLATAMVQPTDEPRLEYRGPAHLGMAGELGPPGTVKQRGLALQIPLLGCLALLVIALVVIIVVVLITVLNL